MPDHDFTYSYVPAGYASRVQWLSVLFPLCQPCRTAREVRYHTEKLGHWWRGRLEELRGQDWGALQSMQALQAARNCCPTITFATPRSRPCHLRAICPFCYARWSRSIWEATERLFHAETADKPKWYREDDELESEADAPLRSRYLLVERYVQCDVRYYNDDGENPAQLDANLASLLRVLPRRRSEAVPLLNALGAFQTTTIEPEERAWRVRNRQLLMYKSDAVLPEEFFEDRENRTVRIHKLPTRAVLLKAVSHVCRYPTAMMTAEPWRVAHLLEQRRRSRCRLTATYGAFRGNDDD